jgi:hypothetical protein
MRIDMAVSPVPPESFPIPKRIAAARKFPAAAPRRSGDHLAQLRVQGKRV